MALEPEELTNEKNPRPLDEDDIALLKTYVRRPPPTRHPDPPISPIIVSDAKIGFVSKFLGCFIFPPFPCWSISRFRTQDLVSYFFFLVKFCGTVLCS